MVYVEKGGEIIPKIVGVDESKRATDSRPVEYISKCPECGTELIRNEGEAVHYCPNQLGCPPQIKGRMEHFISRKAMDIDGLGAETIELLYDNSLIGDIHDIYELKKEDLMPLERLAEKSVNNLLEGIEASKSIPFERVLYAIGIRFVGQTVAKTLAKNFKSMDALQKASYDELIEVDEVGTKIAESVTEFFSEQRNLDIIQSLSESGLQMEIDRQQLQNASDVLGGNTFVVSGVFEHHSRDEIKELIQNHGGKNVGSISGKTNYVLAGANMGPAKFEKAKKLEIPIISEQDFVKMIGKN